RRKCRAGEQTRIAQLRATWRGLARQGETRERRGDQQSYGRVRVRGLYRGEGQGSLSLMRYLPKSPAERQEMLAAVGVKSIDELFDCIPERYRLREALKLPGPLSEAEVISYFQDRAKENSAGYTS